MGLPLSQRDQDTQQAPGCCPQKAQHSSKGPVPGPTGDKNWPQLGDGSSPEAGYSPPLLFYKAEAVCQRLLCSLIAPPFEGHLSPHAFPQ